MLAWLVCWSTCNPWRKSLVLSGLPADADDALGAGMLAGVAGGGPPAASAVAGAAAGSGPDGGAEPGGPALAGPGNDSAADSAWTLMPGSEDDVAALVLVFLLGAMNGVNLGCLQVRLGFP